MLKKLLRRLFVLLLLLSFLGLVAGAGVAWWGYNYITRDLPRLSRIEDYQPPAVTSIYAADSTLIGEFFEQRRYPVKISEVPLFVRNCFLAAEDANFYSHPGVDIVSIARAFWVNLRAGHTSQGGSTITQQVVKNLLLTREKTFERKAKEAILSYRLEKRFSKDEILEIYLNQIFFGHTAYGIKAAAQIYFRKNLSELTLGEAAMLAGLPKAPSRYSPYKNFERARRRQAYVLGQMVRAGFITPERAKIAKGEEIVVYPAEVKTIFEAPYYVSEVRRRVVEDGFLKKHELDNGGYRIYTALDLKANALAERAVKRGLEEVDKRRGWRGPKRFVPFEERAEALSKLVDTIGDEELQANVIYPALVKRVSQRHKLAEVSLGKHIGLIELAQATWARKRLEEGDKVRWIKPERELRVGDEIEVSLALDKEGQPLPHKPEGARAMLLNQTPNVQGAMVVIDPHSGKVLTLIGGYSYKQSVFNRATQAYRQPGSAFKPIVYHSAIEGFNYTPSTTVYDEERTFRVGDDYWTPQNYEKNYMGGITLRVALQKSRNLVSADIISRIGVDAVINFARKMGIEAPLGRNLSLSLGSSEVTVLEMTRAYGVFAAQGVLFDSVFITRIEDRSGEIVYDYERERLKQAKQVLNPNAAFVTVNLMRGVIDYGTGYRVKSLGRPAAGKTGTSNDQMDAWFIGYTPELVCGVWGGFDLKKTIGKHETGGRVSAPTWLYFMQPYLAYLDQLKYEQLVAEAKAEAEELGIEYIAPEELPPLDFQVPDGVDPYWVDRTTGILSEAGAENVVREYFVTGTEPPQAAYDQGASSYLESTEL